MGWGGVVLLDPPKGPRIGSYDLLFFTDEGGQSPVFQISIAPGTSLKQSADEDEDEEGSNQDGPEDGLCDEGEKAYSFDLVHPGRPNHSLRFDDAKEAEKFARDFKVRQRVVKLALQRVQKQAEAHQLTGKLTELKNKTVLARLRRFFAWSVFLFTLVWLCHSVYSFAKTPGISVVDALFNSMRVVGTVGGTTVGSMWSSTVETVCDRCRSTNCIHPEIERCVCVPSYA